MTGKLKANKEPNSSKVLVKSSFKEQNIVLEWQMV